MGNCATCCGKNDGNEVVTEKHYHAKVKGVYAEAPGVTSGHAYG